MLNAVFIIWRECFEAVLIIGILYSFLKRQKQSAHALRFLVGGVLSGFALSAFLAYGIQHAETELQGKALDSFQIGMLVLASVLMTQMCIWMKRHSRTIKSELEQGLTDEETILKNVAKLTKIIEEQVRCFPHEWGGWIHKRWKSRTMDQQAIIDKMEEKEKPDSYIWLDQNSPKV